ncbi:protein-associating with the carboxyl-terminal domain of ezrin-like [Physella acuta]|uniref:protein-associating with the carboxyl-terminal domain of ezrin-like n=1 Tax=Physella acuta TaxID=109671 RepID=UPI0027DD5C9A|nr:protein-associating with the carboxyl-terminal domain of ezrin-like [Physella acuta]
MGAENSILEGCQWDDPIECPPSFQWQLSPIKKSDGTEATVFEPKNTEGKDAHLLKKCALVLRSIRHPNILRFVGYSESSTNVWLATESVLPLVTALKIMSSEELCLGLYDLLQGLHFLHSKLGISHNNLCLSSVFVSPDGTWKLGGMEHSCKFTEATQGYLDKCRAFRCESSLAPEEKYGQVSIDGTLGHARDIYAIKTLVDAALDLVLIKDETIQTMELELSKCSSVDPGSRPKVSDLLEASSFRSELINIINFLKHITVKTETETKEFFSNLMPRLRKLPETVIARRLVVPLLARFVLLNQWAEELVLPHLLMPKGNSELRTSSIEGLIDETLYRTYVINHLFNIFHVHDSHIRLILLKHFSHYVHLFSRTQLEEDIFIQILLGVRDSDDRIVAASLRALADLVPHLGGDFVIGGNRKPFFFHGIPKKITHDEIVQMDIPQNMMSALSSHKPLLKDLAKGSKKFTLSKEKVLADQEKKLKEKLQKKEEARLKREERKRKLKEKELAGCVENGLPPTSEETADSGNDEISEEVKDDADDVDVEEESLQVDKNSPAWSEWDEFDQQIDAEIESELQSMTTITDGDGKVQTSPSPYRSQTPPSPPPVKMDWSDPVVDSDLKKGVEVKEDWLTYDKNNKNNNEQVEWDNAAGHTMFGHVKSSHPSAGSKSLKLNSTAALNKSHTKKTEKPVDDLGMGLDIKSIEIKTKPDPELDFFADMAPSIAQPKGVVPLVESTDNFSPKVSGQNVGTIFAMATLEEDAAGWGDLDTDWGTDQ